jgi:hypothetical protein
VEIRVLETINGSSDINGRDTTSTSNTTAGGVVTISGKPSTGKSMDHMIEMRVSLRREHCLYKNDVLA